jgi:hypothetical protein
MTLWNETHLQLQDAMKKEIETMREILGNMKEEEHFLVHKDKTAWHYTIEERTQLLNRLTEVQKQEHKLAISLQQMVLPHNDNELHSLEEILPRDDENRSETLSLRDQILALIDRMNLQSSRNEMLFELAKYREKYPTHPQEQSEKKGKISLATMPEEEDNAAS